MDLKTLKLELLERIALLEDETRLRALKRLLDSPRGYGIPNDHLSVVREGEEPYIKLEDRSYSAEEVRKLMEELQQIYEGDAALVSPEELAELDASREQYLRGEGTWYTLEELEARMKQRRDH